MVIDIAQLALMAGTFLAETALGNIVGTAFEAVGDRLLDSIRVKYPASQRLLGELKSAPRDGRHRAALIDGVSKQLAADEEFRRQIAAILQELLQRGWVMPNLPPPTAPHQLTADIPEFTGRKTEMDAILKEARLERNSATVVVVTGFGGTGKTALALHAANDLKDEYPGGQLYVNLQGADAQPSSPLEVLADFLRALGVVEADIPTGLEEREAKYRSLLAERKALILLDNARDEVQVEPLIPGGKGCLVLITSRWSLTGLDGAALRVELGTLTDADALALLVHWIGVERVKAEPEAALKVVRLCGNLPLAVRIAGGELIGLAVKLDQYAVELGDESRRLEMLQSRDRAVRASFMLSYQRLSPWEKRLFRLLGLLRGESFAPGAALALDGGKKEYVWKVLGRLVDAQLIGVSGTRYSIHDLMHLLARERLVEEETTEQDAALRRLAGWLADESKEMCAWLSADTRAQKVRELRRAGVHIESGDRGGFFDALNWFELERVNLLAAVEGAHSRADWELTWELAINSAAFYNLRSHWADWERTHVLALDAARRKSDEGAEGVVLNLLGNVHRHQGRWEQAAGMFRQSLELNRRLGNVKGESIALNLLANVLRLRGDWEQALELFEEALALNTRHGNLLGRSIALGGVANVHRMQGRWEQALGEYTQCLEMAEQLKDRYGRAINLNMRGLVLARLGRLKEAERDLTESLTLCREHKGLKGECIARRILGDVYMLRRDWETALEYLTSSLRIARRSGDKRCTFQALTLLGEWHAARGNWEQAEACLEEARDIVMSMDDRHDEGVALRSLAGLRSSQEGPEAAVPLYLEALELLNPGSPEYKEAQAWLKGHRIESSGKTGKY
jgi:tetratricopeptide (TPR) repeat protein